MVPTIDLPAFEALAALPGVTAIDFTAAWCAPCKTMEPILASLATEYHGRARVVAVDVNDEPILAERCLVDVDVRARVVMTAAQVVRGVARDRGKHPRGIVRTSAAGSRFLRGGRA